MVCLGVVFKGKLSFFLLFDNMFYGCYFKNLYYFRMGKDMKGVFEGFGNSVFYDLGFVYICVYNL